MRETTLVTDICSIDTVLFVDDLLESVVALGAHLHGLVKVACANGDNHKLLEGEGVSGVRSAVDDIHAWSWELVRSLLAGELGEVDVERDALQDEHSALLNCCIENPTT